MGSYDLIYMGDALEHFPKERGWEMLDKLALHATGYLLLAVPLGEEWEQGEVFGNPHEAHLSVWTFDEFAPFVEAQELMDNPANRGFHGMFLIPHRYRSHRLQERATLLVAEGRHDEALVLLSPDDLPIDLNRSLMIVDILLQTGRTAEGVARLEETVALFPDEASLPPLLNQLKDSLDRR